MSRPFSLFRSSCDCVLRSQRRRLHYLRSKRRDDEVCTSRVLAARRYAATAAVRLSESSGEQRHEYLDDEEPGSSSASSRHSEEPRMLLHLKPRPKADPKPLVEHLGRLFPPLEFPDTVATQVMTHISAQEAWAGHNARLAFVGRRVLQSYLLLFLQDGAQKLARTTSPSADLDKTLDFDRISYKTLHTHLLGEYVGSRWELARTMLWTPPVRTAVKESPLTKQFAADNGIQQESPASLKSPGLYKVQGTTVEGIMGGIFHQFGGTVAQRVFHTRLLPHILCPGTPFGLHDAFHPAAREMQARMGGPDGLLLPRSGSPERRDIESVSQRDVSEENVSSRTDRSSPETLPSLRKRFLF